MFALAKASWLYSSITSINLTKATLRPPMKAMELYELLSWVIPSVILTFMTKFWNELQYGLLTIQRFVASLKP